MTTLADLLHPPTTAPPALGSLGQTALAYAQHGWRVFPLAPRSKRPIRSPGFHTATWDPVTIRAWWTADGRRNIGLATGAGLIAIDCDPAHGAGAWWAVYGPALRQTVAARSGNGGWHLLLRVPPDCEIRNSSARLAPGVDVRGDGGY
ncbi:MAG: bifunctional DNA primase/polymerase, partial [Chloroflexota bacterium]|nr:bifunctional DNA primase/polymerase [Chloroflexota bacterium]